MALRASRQTGNHPRPRLLRERWESLDGPWEFRYDDSAIGLAERWYADDAAEFPLTITVPFVPESAASGIGDTSFHETLWYRRTIRHRRRPGTRLLLHVGAVDHHAIVWVDGTRVAEHSGGQTSFAADITDALADGEEHVVVIRAHDCASDTELPRGKQDWRPEPHAIWYQRSTGIWRSVWIEEVRDLHILDYAADYLSGEGAVRVSVVLSARPPAGGVVRMTLRHGEAVLGSAEVAALDARIETTLELPALRNAQQRESLLWSPEHPELIDLELEVSVPGEEGSDLVAGYTGLRSVGAARGAFLLNHRPRFLRSVLEQGYWTESHLTAPTPEHYRLEVEAILALGFNAVRLHQKVEDPRFLHWADRLGLLVWGETAAAYEYTPRAAAALMSEWSEIVSQYRGYPSIVTWVPVNESWGVQDLATAKPQSDFVRAIASYTRALDPERPVVSNDGWEHVDSDLLTIHDYTADPAVLEQRYGSRAGVDAVVDSMGPSGRRPILDDGVDGMDRRPVLVSEFGGIAYSGEGTWGYAVVASEDQFREKVAGLIGALNASPIIAGYCYTQLTDTLQEANGLLDADRRPKLPLDVLRGIVLGG